MASIATTSTAAAAISTKFGMAQFPDDWCRGRVCTSPWALPASQPCGWRLDRTPCQIALPPLARLNHRKCRHKHRFAMMSGDSGLAQPRSVLYGDSASEDAMCFKPNVRPHVHPKITRTGA